MSKLLIFPALNDQEFKTICELMNGYILKNSCSCRLDTLLGDQWCEFKIQGIRNCESCLNKYQKIVREYMQGNVASFDHTALYYLRDYISPKYPDHTFTGYSVAPGFPPAEPNDPICARFDKYIYQNGKEIYFDGIYLYNFDWNTNYESQFGEQEK